MRDKNQIESLLTQVADLINMIQNHTGPISDNISSRVLEEIERLEKAIALFDEINRKSLEEANIDIERLRMEFARSPLITPKDKQLMQRARDIERDAKNLQLAFSKVIERGQSSSAALEKAAKDPLKQQIKERRKRFKPLGGNKNWIPM
ncbi:hypothetical protein [Candidatus Protochlamydia phocaeensis]|uniref:hypothetical protein n=1 Tax=Candidatus Protochlamydia phocaeensis TaxID=1414722 RepID=UPI0008399180|nr:hypothetical protein [Candidatus Protochlamydia phocaeensis]